MGLSKQEHWSGVPLPSPTWVLGTLQYESLQGRDGWGTGATRKTNVHCNFPHPWDSSPLALEQTPCFFLQVFLWWERSRRTAIFLVSLIHSPLGTYSSLLCSGIGGWSRGWEEWGQREGGGDSFWGFPGPCLPMWDVSVCLFISVSGGGLWFAAHLPPGRSTQPLLLVWEPWASVEAGPAVTLADRKAR